MYLYYSIRFIVIFLLLCNLTVVHGVQNCSWIITDDDQVETKDIHCLQYSRFSVDCQSSSLPILYDDNPVDKPKTFKVEVNWVRVSISGSEWQMPQIEFTWTPPESGGSLNRLTGFLINAECFSVAHCSKASFCIMFVLRYDNSFKLQDRNLTFKWKSPPLNINYSAYEFELYSLPKLESLLKSEHKIYRLNIPGAAKIKDTQGTSETPNDTSPSDAHQTTIPPIIDPQVTPETDLTSSVVHQTTVPSTDAPQVNIDVPVNITVSVTATLLCAAGIIFLAYLLYRKKTNKAVIVDHLQKKSILILNAEDHQHHVESVKQLVLFLQDECHCLPVYPPFCLKEISHLDYKDWMLKTLDTVDYVIIVDSEASYYLMEAESKNNSYKYHPITSTGNLFTDFMKEVFKESKNTESLDRYIMVSLDHTSSEFYLPAFPTNHCYKIIQQIPDLVKYIHHQTPELDTHPQLRDVFTKSIDDFDTGKSLKDALYKAAKFEKSNVTWFSERFGEPYGRVYENRDSGIGSFIGHGHNTEDIRRIDSEPQFQTDVGEESNDSTGAGVDEHGWFPPDIVSSYSEATVDQISFVPPETLSEMETKSLSPSIYMGNMNARYEAAVNDMKEKDKNMISTSDRFNEKDETDYYSNLKDTTWC